MNTKEVLTEIDETITEFCQHISSFTQEQTNVVPFEGSWTAGQLAKHVIMSASGFLEIMNGPVKETERKPDEMAATIKRDFLDFNTK
jgi:hypothetical protein